MRKSTRGLGINPQIGVAAFYSQRKRSIGMQLSQSDVSFSPSEIHIGQTRNDIMDGVNLTLFQLQYTIKEGPGFFLSIEHHQRSTAQSSQPDLDIKTQRLTVELHDRTSTLHLLNIHLNRFSPATPHPSKQVLVRWLPLSTLHHPQTKSPLATQN